MEKRRLRQLILALIVLVILLGGWNEEEAWAKEGIEELQRIFRTIDNNLGAMETDASRLAWGESYALMGYVAMYEGDGDVEYLKKALYRFEEVLAIRDDRRKLVDEFRQRVMPAWSTGRYTEGKQYVWLVDTGMIIYPMARWAYLVKRDAALLKHYSSNADRLIKEVKETVASFDGDWREGGDNREGYYYDQFLKRDIPFNQQNALGRALIALWLATGEEEYRSKAEKLARFFKNRLIVKGKRYIWTYWPGGKGSEDIGHAAINVDFAFMCYRAGLVFTKEDMKRFCDTFKYCARDEAGFTLSVDGTGDFSRSRLMGLWGHLGFLDPEVRRLLYRYFTQNWPTGERTWMTSAAYLVETQRPLKLDRVVR